MPWRVLRAGAILAALAAEASAQPDASVSAGDTAWLLASAALVMMMTAPGLAFFYGGLVSQRNMLATLMQSFFLLCLISVQWIAFGYSLAFGTDHGGLVGGLELLFFGGVGQQPRAGQTVPHLAFAIYEGMFAVITPALITGAFAERLRFSAFLPFSLLWATFVYDPLCHWVWGGGWLAKLGMLDFAGGTVVHVSAGVSALVAVLVIGKRSGYPQRVAPPHSLTLTLLGGALAANGIAASAFVATHASAAAAGLAWALVEWAHRGKPTVLGAVTAAVAGLVAITPAAGYVTPAAALLIGAGSTAVCYLGVNVLKPRFGYDDSLDVFGVHGLGGTWGALATGLFASRAVNPAGADGLLRGNSSQLLTQLIGVAAGWAIAGAGTFLVLKLVALMTPLRATEEEEILGLDLSLHGEAAYSILGSSAMPASSVGAPYHERTREQAPAPVSRG